MVHSSVLKISPRRIPPFIWGLCKSTIDVNPKQNTNIFWHHKCDYFTVDYSKLLTTPEWLVTCVVTGKKNFLSQSQFPHKKTRPSNLIQDCLVIWNCCSTIRNEKLEILAHHWFHNPKFNTIDVKISFQALKNWIAVSMCHSQNFDKIAILPSL